MSQTLAQLVDGVFESYIEGLKILRPYAERVYLDYVPNTYPNGTEKNPSRLYINVEMNFGPDAPNLDHKPELIARLKELGWREECEGQFYVYEQW